MRLTRINKPVEGEKRQHFPYMLEWVCPRCGEDHVYDYASEYYLSSPLIPAVKREHRYCDECGFEDDIYFRVDMTMEIVDEP